MPIHVVISDTHAPDMIQEILEDVRRRVLKEFSVDAIVINGDLLGVFSMKKSSVHKKQAITRADRERYLRLAAPKWYAQYNMPRLLGQEEVLAYVRERYKWVVKILREFSEIAATYWNMGNHESPLHFLVLRELAFLLDVELPHVPDSSLQEIFVVHEQDLGVLELTNNFTYLRTKPVVVDDTLILAIPGESHESTGLSAPARAQEKRTKQLIAQAQKLLPQVSKLVIYNHTQGTYEKTTGMFSPASSAAKKFLRSLPSSLDDVVWVQSHNHWGFTQYLRANEALFLLNNAGLHAGIYNVLDVGDSVRVFDVHTRTNEISELVVSSKEVHEDQKLEMIKRNYKNFMDVFLHRKMLPADKQPIRK